MRHAMQLPTHETVPPEVIKALPGTIGAIVALRWISGTPLQRIAAVVGGAAASWYAGEHVAVAFEVGVGLAGFLVGLFGMALASKVFEAIVEFEVGKALARLLHKLGL